MKKIIGSVLASIACALSAQAQAPYFTPGNLAVLRISGNDADGAATGIGAAIYIDQYTTSGVLVNSYSVPSTGANALILTGEPYEGLLTLTPDGAHLVFAAFNTPTPYTTTNLTFSSSSSVPRAVATLDAFANLAMPIVSTVVFNGYSANSAASDGVNYWMGGTGPPGGDAYAVYVGTATSSTAVALLNGANAFGSGFRSVNILSVAGVTNLYATGYTSNSAWDKTTWGSGTFLVSNISGQLPTAATECTNYFPTGSEANSTPSDVAINPAGTIAYVADDGLGITKFTNNGSGWISNYTVVPTNTGYASASGSKEAIALTADFTQSPPVVYATTSETFTNRLIMFQDTGALPTIVNLASGSIVSGAGGVTNTFRGVRFVPLPVPQFTLQPVPFFGVPGTTATFSSAATGYPTPTYQWYSNSPAAPTFVAISGATSSNLNLANINQNQNGSQFYVVASNSYGMPLSTVVTLTVQNPAIVTAPVGVTNFPGTGPNTLCVTAIGTGTLTYQWLSNGMPITNAQSSCYTVPNSAVSNTASYSVIVSNSLNQSITSSATVVSYTPYLLYDTLAYPNGNIVGDATSPWTEESGNKLLEITNDTLQIDQTIGATGTAFVQSLYDVPEINEIFWVSFIVNLKSLPATSNGTYFAYFQSTNFNFYGRIIALTANSNMFTPDIAGAAYPGTYRLGIANNQTAASAVVELDMAPGIDYQVVAYFDETSGDNFCQLAVNPSPTNYAQIYSPGVDKPSPLVSGVTSDSLAPTNLPMAAYGFRQAADVGVLDIHDLQVSYDWSGPGSGYTAVTAGIAPALPVIGFLSPGFTNYAGNSNVLEVAASGIGLTYSWYLGAGQLTDTTLPDGCTIVGSSTPTLTLSDYTTNESGNYTVVVSNSVGPVTSSNVVVYVNGTSTAPSFTAPGGMEPSNIVTSLGQTVTFTAAAVGTGPMSYEWNVNGSPNGATGPTLTLPEVSTNLSGNLYSVTATGGTGLMTTSSNALLTVNGPIITNIAYLRTLMVTNAAPSITLSSASNATAVYEISGVVTCSKDLESATYADYTIQDSTGGIEVFVTDNTFHPSLGDVIYFTGVLDVYSDDLEIDGTANDAAEPYGYVTNSMGQNITAPIPAPLLLPWSLPGVSPDLVAQQYCGSLVIVTNAYFTTNGVFGNEQFIYLTNNAGVSNNIGLWTAEGDGADVIGAPIPAFAYSITAPLLQYSTDEYELNVTAAANIVTAPPPAVTNLTAAASGSNVVLSWTAVPNTYSYTIQTATNLLGPWTPLAGVLPSTASEVYSFPAPTNGVSAYYRLVCP